ncbi:ferritin-like domain-containing protein [Hymenobacter sp. BT770]|uniref:ferritin-like domain-containing protein n=1 Tax=Hymenobacter sp. BT770 TaxID=2886942 RepID=UPI001D0F89EA|nr:ferritin-like domain-containing protein [Hymenobacter sp. BT770]MCC3151810.1 ferritin-like domain-containing protein [Hymenobacter sp. BT770]MDO3413568.1 ferritin-like domain-containing protein [Hymenobacter sp. BT770]
MSDSYFSQPGALHRRTFLRVAGASAATASLVLAGCSTDTPTPTPVNPNLLTLGSADTGLLNYLYLLEQLKTAFYQKVVDAPPADLRTGEKAIFDDLRDHELVHRETLRYILGTDAFDAALSKPLAFDFSSLTLTTRAGVLAGAQQLEDLGVAAYTGALRLLKTITTVSLLAKVVSVEARHAALVRDLRTPGSFAGDDVVISTGALQSVSLAKTPVQVVAEAKAFFLPIVVSTDSLPTA